MLKIENTQVVGWEPAIRGMRNPKNSWDRSDTKIECPWEGTDRPCGEPDLGPNDHQLMMSLAKGGPVHAKYRRMIVVYLDITAPLYWWKEFDTYKVGTVANSCSTMHKIHAKEFTMDDFSHEHLLSEETLVTWNDQEYHDCAEDCLHDIVGLLNAYRSKFLETKDKRYWWQMIQLLPSSYNQKRTVMLNYEVLHNIYFSRKDHKLDEWHTFCDWIKTLPCSELIIGEDGQNACDA